MSLEFTKYSEPGTYGTSRFEITANGKRVAVFDRIEDAHLFRAAHELLAALEMIAKQCGPYAEVQPALDYASIGNIARAAIANARSAK